MDRWWWNRRRTYGIQGPMLEYAEGSCQSIKYSSTVNSGLRLYSHHPRSHLHTLFVTHRMDSRLRYHCRHKLAYVRQTCRFAATPACGLTSFHRLGLNHISCLTCCLAGVTLTSTARGHPPRWRSSTLRNTHRGTRAIRNSR